MSNILPNILSEISVDYTKAIEKLADVLLDSLSNDKQISVYIKEANLSMGIGPHVLTINLEIYAK